MSFIMRWFARSVALLVAILAVMNAVLLPAAQLVLWPTTPYLVLPLWVGLLLASILGAIACWGWQFSGVRQLKKQHQQATKEQKRAQLSAEEAEDTIEALEDKIEALEIALEKALASL